MTEQLTAAIEAVTGLVGDVATLVTGNIIFLLPVVAGMLTIGVRMFKKLRK